MKLKYGENPHQEAVIEFAQGNDQLALGRFELNGKRLDSYDELPLSSTLLTDLDRALETMIRIKGAIKTNHLDAHSRLGLDDATLKRRWGKDGPDLSLIAIVVKHGNPCGAAVGEDPIRTFVDAHRGDSRAAFGGLVLTNFEVPPEAIDAARKVSKTLVLSALVSSAISEGVEKTLTRKAGTTHFLTNGSLWHRHRIDIARGSRYRYLRGARIAMQPSVFVPDFFRPEYLVGHAPEAAVTQIPDLALAWAVGSTSNSNTVSLAKGGMVIGNGVGQQDRVSCCELAIKRARDAGHDTQGAVAYSDSFFPFPDGIERLAEAGIRAVLASSGSVNDDKVIAAVNGRMNVFMVPDKEGRGFYGH